MRFQTFSALMLAAVTLHGALQLAAAQTTLPKAGALYIIEAANATFVNANTLVLSVPSAITTYRVTYPYKDAGVLDTSSVVANPVFAPGGVWLGGATGTIFGNGPNSTAVLLAINGLPVLDPVGDTLTLNVTIIADPTYLKFSDGVARATYNNAVTPNAFQKTVTVTALVTPGAVLTGAALFLDVDQTAVVPASVAAIPPTPASTTTTTNNNNNGGVTNNNNNGGGATITNNNGVPSAGGFTNNNNNGGGFTTTTNSNGAGITNNNNNGAAGTGITNNNNGASSSVSTGSTITNNNNNGNGTPVPSTPGQTPPPGTYNVITTTTNCNGQTTVEYSYIPGLRGVSRNNNNNCG